MGMNIYTLKGKHIGKRSAAGFWCWDCKIQVESKNQFFICPKCGLKVYEQTAIKGFNPAYRELGFTKAVEQRRTGIAGASHFTWHAKDRSEADKMVERKKFFKTEYGEIWNAKRFQRMFKEVISESFLDSDFS